MSRQRSNRSERTEEDNTGQNLCTAVKNLVSTFKKEKRIPQNLKHPGFTSSSGWGLCQACDMARKTAEMGAVMLQISWLRF